VQAGEPGNLGPLDFIGLRMLAALLAGGTYYLVMAPAQTAFEAIRNTFILGGLGFYVPLFWLRSAASGRKRQILRALPDALDMLTICVEAGLAFESALGRVAAKWDNPLGHEIRRMNAEMRVGATRETALRRMAARCGVPELTSFVSVLIQSTQLGVTVAQVLHSQASDMRLRRHQRSEELARQASVKLVFPLVVLLFPAMFVVILGPSAPAIVEFINAAQGAPLP
jgi:tight adherence protein C